MINTFLLGLRPSQQVGLLFVLLFGMLAAVSIYAVVMSMRERPEDDPRERAFKEFNGVLRTSWVMAVVFWVGWALGDTVATVLFGVVAFFALREFITLSPTRQGDHRSLVLAFFVVLPVQFYLVITRRFDLVWHQPCTGAAAAQVSGLRGKKCISGVFSGVCGAKLHAGAIRCGPQTQAKTQT